MRKNKIELPDSIEEAVKILESAWCGLSTPGTMIQRSLGARCVEWSLSVGRMGLPKVHYTGQTIKECFENAFAEFNK